MDQTLLKFAHVGLSLADHPMTISCNKIIKSFNNGQLLTSDTPLQTTIYNFYKLNTPLKFPQTLAQDELLVNCSFNHSLDWTLTECTQILILLSAIHGLFYSMNINSIHTQHIIYIERQYLNQPSTSRPPSRVLIHGSPPHISQQSRDKLHASSPKSQAQHLAKTAPNAPVNATTNIANAHNNTHHSSSHHTPFHNAEGS